MNTEMHFISVVPVENLMDTAKHLYLKEYRKVAKDSGHFSEKLENDGVFTVFAPHNRAFNDMPASVR